MDRGAWQATDHSRVHKELDMTEPPGRGGARSPNLPRRRASRVSGSCACPRGRQSQAGWGPVALNLEFQQRSSSLPSFLTGFFFFFLSTSAPWLSFAISRFFFLCFYEPPWQQARKCDFVCDCENTVLQSSWKVLLRIPKISLCTSEFFPFTHLT